MRLLPVWLAIAILGVAAGCSGQKPSDSVNQTEEMLSDAGFNPVELNSPDEIAIAQTLPKHEMHYYDTVSGPVFWYYDPDGCGCVYVGGVGDYQRYQVALSAQNDVADYLAESEDSQVTSLYTIDPLAFPSPYLYATGVAFNYNGGLYSWYPHPPIVIGGHGSTVGSAGNHGGSGLGHGIGGMGHGFGGGMGHGGGGGHGR
jgi:hypothetical protein